MTADELLRELEARNIRVHVENGRLRTEGLVTPRLRGELAVLERALVARLTLRVITCPHYEPLPGTERCGSYHSNGVCGRPNEFMCVEWLKVNRERP